jgi:hypothetical protein
MKTVNGFRFVLAAGIGLVALVVLAAPALADATNAGNFANWADLKCYKPEAQQILTNVPPITISQLNPMFLAPNPVIPDHDVQLNDLQQLCVPVEKNNTAPPTDTTSFLRYFDLACYGILSPSSVTLPPMVLQHRNPVLVNPATTPPGVLPANLQREVVSFGGPPTQLCVPVAKNQSQFPIPASVLRLVQYLDFECFDFSAASQTPVLNANLLLTHLNPALVQQQPEQVLVTNAHKLCVPVNKNHTAIPVDVLNVINKVDLKKYDITSAAGATLPPVTVGLQITQLDPILTTAVPPVTFSTMTPQQMMLPVKKCNPYRVRSQTVIPPDNFFSGQLYFNLQSNCPGSPRACGGAVTLPMNTTATSKCNLLVSAINSSAACMAAGFVASTPDACASGTFEVADTACTSTTFPPGSGLALGLSNDDTVFTQEASGTTLPDYEMDIITPPCGGRDGGGTGTVKGTPTGTPFIPGSTASVTFAVDLTNVGGSLIQVTVPTQSPTGGLLTPDQIVNQGVQMLNGNLGGTGVTCTSFTGHNRSFQCSAPSGDGIGVGVQLNDTGMNRALLAGAPPITQAMGACTDTGGSQCKRFQSANVVTPSPVPALPVTVVALTLLVLGGVALGVLRRRQA